MTLAILVLSSLIIHKIFTSSSSSSKASKQKEIILAHPEIKAMSLTEDEIALLTQQNELIIINRATGKEKESFLIKKLISDD